MGFRNPLTTLTADQIDPGTLGTGVIAQSVLSAPTGNRISVAQVGAVGMLGFYAGIGGESPGQVAAETSGGVAGDQVLTIRGGTNPVTEPVTGPPQLMLYCAQDASGDWRSHAQIDVDDLELSDGPGLAKITLDGTKSPNPPTQGLRIILGRRSYVSVEGGREVITFAPPFANGIGGLVATTGAGSAGATIVEGDTLTRFSANVAIWGQSAGIPSVIYFAAWGW